MTNERPASGQDRGTERRLLVAVDDSASSRRAVEYVADFFGDYADLAVTLLSILPEPSADYFPSAAEREQWLAEQRRRREAALADYRKLLVAGGMAGERIESRLVVRPCASIADAILEEQEQLRCCIVALGRRGLSHTQEFVVGSTSTRVLHNARACAVLVVE